MNASRDSLRAIPSAPRAAEVSLTTLIREVCFDVLGSAFHPRRFSKAPSIARLVPDNFYELPVWRSPGFCPFLRKFCPWCYPGQAGHSKFASLVRVGVPVVVIERKGAVRSAIDANLLYILLLICAFDRAPQGQNGAGPHKKRNRIEWALTMMV